MIAGKALVVHLAPKRKKRKQGDTRRMTRNSKPPAVRQQLLFSHVAQRLVELSNDKQQELRTAVAELLLNAIAGDKPIDSGETTDDKSQAHA
jgi:hypothetical protein